MNYVWLDPLGIGYIGNLHVVGHFAELNLVIWCVRLYYPRP